MVRGKTKVFSLALAIIFSLRATAVFADMSSTNYQIQWDEVSSGGGVSSSGTYHLRDGVGTQAGATASSTSYQISQGFRSGVYDPVVNFVPYVQDRSTQVGATSFTTPLPPVYYEVEVTTTAGFSVGAYALVVQNEGASQTSFMSRITGMTSVPPVLTLSSDYSGAVPTIDGTNDYVYVMNSGTSLDLGTLSTSTVSTHTVGWVSTSDVNDGYSVYMFSNGALTTGSSDISGVSDGTVSAGSSEYGGRSSDVSLSTSTFDTQDTAFTPSPALVASEGSHPFTRSGFVTLKAAISSSQTAGTYGQVLHAVFVGEY